MVIMLDNTKGEQVYRGLIITSPKEGVWKWRNPLTFFESADMQTVEAAKADIDRELPTQVVGEVGLPDIYPSWEDAHHIKAELKKLSGMYQAERDNRINLEKQIESMCGKIANLENQLSNAEMQL